MTTRLTAVSMASALLALTGCGSGDDADSGPIPLTVPRAAACAASDTPESALQGQVPASMRAAGFKGFNCNLRLVGQAKGEGGNWSSATFTDGAGHTCAYHATATPQADRVNPGVPVIDITDRAHPLRTTSLTTLAMLDPWESLRVDPRRQVLIADNGANGAGGPQVDLYDLSGDCRSPQLLATVAVGTGTDGGLLAPSTPIGHEGNLAPDGLTYYMGSTSTATYYAVDITNTTKPKLLSTFSLRSAGLSGTAHGLSVSNDGNRIYAAALAIPAAGALTDPSVPATNGFVVLDTSQVQQRLPNAQIKLVSQVFYKDASVSQHTLPITVAGKPYLVQVDEGGAGGLAQTAGVTTACAAGLPGFPFARIYDLSDDTKPALVSKLLLETHDPANCSAVLPDIVGLSIFTYGSHYCTVDNRDNATALACAYQNSGIRVFDIRDPLRPKEIAYFNPPAVATPQPGSSQVRFRNWVAGGPDWCSSRVDFDFAKKQLVTMCQNNGLVILQFEGDTWPFEQSTRSTSQS